MVENSKEIRNWRKQVSTGEEQQEYSREKSLLAERKRQNVKKKLCLKSPGEERK